MKTLRQRRYDLVIDFHGLFKSSIIVFLSRGKENWAIIVAGIKRLIP